VFIAIALGIGAVSFHLIERPALAWRRRVLTARAAVASGRGGLSKREQPGVEPA
jgi:peptidoglycan/LPS O-acetylase OafA/YrhL